MPSVNIVLLDLESMEEIGNALTAINRGESYFSPGPEKRHGQGRR